MAIQYGLGLSAATTETPEIPADKLVRRRGVAGTSALVSESHLGLLGRDRSLEIAPAVSYAGGVAFPKRIRQVTAESHAVTEGNLKLMCVSPSLRTPKGQLFLDGAKFNGLRLARNRSYCVDFIIEGNRLANLEITFDLFMLDGSLKLRKTSKANGVVPETDITVDDNGIESWKGFVVLLPKDLDFKTKGDLELNYRFNIGNNSSRDHLLETGYVSFF